MIIVGIVYAIAGFWCGFIFCASLNKKGYEVESESLNSGTITKKQPEEVDESSDKDEVQFLPADIATMYSDMNAAKILDDCLKDIFQKVNEAAQNGQYQVVVQSSIYKGVNANSFIEAMDDLKYRIETGSGRSDYESLSTALTNGNAIKILWGADAAQAYDTQKVEETKQQSKKVDPIKEVVENSYIPNTNINTETDVYHLTLQALRHNQ